MDQSKKEKWDRKRRAILEIIFFRAHDKGDIAFLVWGKVA